MRNSFKFKLLYSAVAITQLLFPAIGESQQTQSKNLPMWKEARRPAAKGTRIPVPPPIMDELAADDCADPTSGETTKMDAYRVRNGNSFLVAVWGRGSCSCSPTGNCAFWVYQLRRGKYEKILDTDMVNHFGFLKAGTNGHRDLVLWSHDSASSSPARLFQFDGKEYNEACGWEEEYTGHDLPGGGWVWDPKPKINSDSCNPTARPD
jgi:hypothetical protein